MSRTGLEVADIFRALGPAWRSANAGHVSLGQIKVMSAIERCRTAALGGAIRSGDYKLIERFDDGSLELFNVVEDPGETRDLASEDPGRAKQLQARLASITPGKV